MAKSDNEIIEWVSVEYMRANTVEDKQEANFIRLRASTIFNKRFPNPDICHCCGKVR